jgi:hypothetical protein
MPINVCLTAPSVVVRKSCRHISARVNVVSKSVRVKRRRDCGAKRQVRKKARRHCRSSHDLLHRRKHHILPERTTKPWDRVFDADARRRMRELIPDIRYLVLHKIRTARSLLSRASVQPHITERVLGHGPGVEGVHDRHSYEHEKAGALEPGKLISSRPLSTRRRKKRRRFQRVLGDKFDRQIPRGCSGARLPLHTRAVQGQLFRPG